MKKKIVISLSALLLVGVTSYTFYDFCSESETVRSPASIPENYESLKGCEKQEILWEKALSSAHKELPPLSKFGFLQLVKMSFQEISLKGSHVSDFAPSGWKKYIHKRGALSKVKIVPVPNDQGLTGVFEGAECGLLRLSLTYCASGSKPVAPGLALKVLRDRSPSANVSALVSLEGQEKDFNFFTHPMSNIVPGSQKFGQKLVHRVFSKVTSYPEETLLSDMASIDSQGNEVKEMNPPRQIFFVPTLQSFSSDDHDVREDFLTIPEGSTIYKVFAAPKEQMKFNYQEYTAETAKEFLKDSVHIADIVTTSPFVASEFGDQGIFFKHQLRPKNK